MSKNTLSPQAQAVRQFIEGHRRHPGEPHLRDVLKREHDESLTRSRDEALEKWGPEIEMQMEERLLRDRYREFRQKGAELDMD